MRPRDQASVFRVASHREIIAEPNCIQEQFFSFYAIPSALFHLVISIRHFNPGHQTTENPETSPCHGIRLSPAMADHEEGVQLFGQCKVCIICSRDVSQDTAQQVCTFIYIDFLQLRLYLLTVQPQSSLHLPSKNTAGNQSSTNLHLPSHHWKNSPI